MGLPLEATTETTAHAKCKARMPSGEPSKYDRITPALQELHWLFINFHSKFKGLGLTFKTLYGLGAVINGFYGLL